MLSRSSLRAAAQGTRQAGLTRPAVFPAAIKAQCTGISGHTTTLPEGRRHVSMYGYTQAKALIYSKYGEPKDVLSLHKHSISAPHGSQASIHQSPPFETSLGTSTPAAVGGNEGAFEVLSVGASVKNLAAGDWVIMKKTGQGTWRTHAQLDESQLIKIENKEGLTPLQVGTVSVNPVTAYRMIRDYCSWDWMRAGEEWLIQNGANSGVGRAAIQFGREWGVKTLNVIRQRSTPEETEALKAELKALGATVVITEEEMLSGNFRDMVHQFTRQGKEPIRLALNCVGGKNATALAKTLAPDSHMVTYGAMSKQPVALPSGLLIFKNLSFDGFWDIPVDNVSWSWDSEGPALAESVQGTLGGYRSGKGVFTFTGGD
ncbi:hypothetical protein N7509_007880 [Penicillium cosmopolitanum]|uniref:Alcohol dehydrogenase-like C-terminal domain-containing protein n=1 Tax=Penicillium cosmopolitanum TaxID=1131564 RepID=A0A9X0B8T1_9EURO|nr:uncharacterized protein N7509_007880 [Penicillium cosmopolitanum]KAJ5392390.1 hypothetical protein N7509_007880 [Penicillium cosmopolitanum]